MFGFISLIPNFSFPEKFPSFQFKTVHSLLPGSQIINNFSIHEVFKVLSFNVLADAYVGNHFPYCEPEFKEFSYRGPQIVKFIEVLNPDIFCLQEADHYQDFYQPALSKKYSLYHEIQDPWLNVGLMIGFKKEKYELLKKSVISFDIYVTGEIFDEKEINKFMFRTPWASSDKLRLRFSLHCLKINWNFACPHVSQ